MNRSFKRDRSLDRYRAEVHEDDCQDPRYFFGKESQSKAAGRKAQQLCAQVEDTLTQLLSGETSDETLQSLQVVGVSPAPNASQLLVLVGALAGTPQLDASQVEAALSKAAGWLRSEVAAAITRKRAPRLSFRFVPAMPAKEVQP